jgi:hypothetical protein
MTASCALVLALLSIGAAEPTKPIDKLGWLVGGVWSADASKLGGGLRRIDTRYEWVPNRSFIRFNTTFVSAGGASPHYAGDFYYDPSQRTLTAWYMDENNVITHGPMTVDGNKWTISVGGSGAPQNAQYIVDIVRTTADTYQWTLFSDVARVRTKVFGLVYRRRSETP